MNSYFEIALFLRCVDPIVSIRAKSYINDSNLLGIVNESPRAHLPFQTMS